MARERTFLLELYSCDVLDSMRNQKWKNIKTTKSIFPILESTSGSAETLNLLVPMLPCCLILLQIVIPIITWSTWSGSQKSNQSKADLNSIAKNHIKKSKPSLISFFSNFYLLLLLFCYTIIFDLCFWLLLINNQSLLLMYLFTFFVYFPSKTNPLANRESIAETSWLSFLRLFY